MKCDKCGSMNVVAKVVIQGEKNTEELNMCPLCFQNFVKEHPEIQQGQAGVSLNNFLLGTLNLLNSNLKPDHAQDRSQNINIRQCSNCGTPSVMVKKNRLTGCAQCYTQFQDEINDILYDSIGTNKLHIQNSPATKKENVNNLIKRLEDAVKMENYEIAAFLRDELKKHRSGRK